MYSHKCGVATYEHLINQHHSGDKDFLKVYKIKKIGNWDIIKHFDEIDLFVNQYNQSQFKKVMITRNPYDRIISFFTNSWWDQVLKAEYSTEKVAHYDFYQIIYGNKYEEVLDLRKYGDFQESFDFFLNSYFVNPTIGSIAEKQTNGGFGNVHLIPQSAKYRRENNEVLLTDIKFIDVKDGLPNGHQSNYLLKFLELPKTNDQLFNKSSGTKRRSAKPASEYFSPEVKKVIDEVYANDFSDFGY